MPPLEAHLTLEIENLPQIIARLGGEVEILCRAAGEGLERGGIRVVNRTRQNCPVATGRLRRSYRSQVTREAEQVHVRVGTDVEYAPYVELGTRSHLAPIGMNTQGRRWLRAHGFVTPSGDVPQYIPVSGKAQPHLFPALEAEKHNVELEVAGAVKRAIRAAGG